MSMTKELLERSESVNPTEQKIYDLMKNKNYADAFHNYFFLLGCNKKKDANVWKKKMDNIEKEHQKSIAQI